MADNKVNFLRGTSAEYEAKTKDNDTFYYTTDTKKLYLGENEVGNGIDPKVIQAHIDNQTIHAKVWRGTQEEYNAIEPKEDDTVYIIKDSDNTLADKLIDDTSTTATDKTWSAKKINENDEAARTAINTHAGNDEIHVTAEEKAAWNGKFDYIGVVRDLFAVNKTCVCAYDMNTLNTPFSSGLTLSGAGLCFVNYVAGAEYATYLVISSGDTNHYAATSNNGSEHVKWHKISDGGNADTLDGKHASDFVLKTDYDALAARVAALEGN